MPGHNRNARKTGNTTQVAVRLPDDLHAALKDRGAIAAQLIAAAREKLARDTTVEEKPRA